jgi:hypothetical protein
VCVYVCMCVLCAWIGMMLAKYSADFSLFFLFHIGDFVKFLSIAYPVI